MSSLPLSCEEIIEQILKGGVDRERVIYKVFREFEGFIHKIAQDLHLPHEIVRDAYYEAIAEFEYKIAAGKFKFQSGRSCSTFIYRICYNKCVDYIRKESKKPYLEDLGGVAKFIPNPELADSIWDDEDFAICWEKLNDLCKEVIGLYLEGYTIDDILNQTDLKNKNSVSVTKYGCIGKLRKCIEKRKSLR